MWFPFWLWINEPLLSAGTIKCSKLFGRMLPGLKGELSRGLVSCPNRGNFLHLANGGLAYLSLGGVRLFGFG
jgi:hypothetical protein